VFVHAFLDGRDSVYNAGKFFVEELLNKMKELKSGQLASMIGRYFAMDRDSHWDRIEKAYRLLTEGAGEKMSDDPLRAVLESYENKIYDEEFAATAITKKGKPVAQIKDNDAVIFFNFRPDRGRELTKAFALPGFDKFARKQLKNLFFVTMTEYEKELPVVVAYPPLVVRNSLAETVSKAGKKQFHVAETEKYAHITFFLNGTVEDPFEGEDRVIIPSPQVARYDQAPEMASGAITKEVVKAVIAEKYDLIAVNFASPDMVAHTGNLPASIKACEVIDKCLGEITERVLAQNGAVVITGDHGNVEEIINLQTGEMDTEHSNNPVPLIIVANEFMGTAGPAGDAPEGDLSLLQPVGMLADVSPTVLKLMGVEQPPEMTGQALI
jgi:2,3-bisphosphoglycerate-independent phosphoglycerate mutase